MDDHACVLAIVGSRDVNVVAAMTLIREALAQHRPIMVVSGGAKANLTNRARGLGSIDVMAAEEARRQGYQVVELLPSTFHWEGPGGFKERNEKIADACFCLVRISSTTSTTYGSGWTADHAERLGKNVERFTISPEGGITNGQERQDPSDGPDWR